MLTMTGFWRSLLLLAGIIGIALVTGCGRTPQVTGDEESVGAMDALWTAVTSQRTALLDQCAGEIERLHNSGRLADDAFEVLWGVVATARSGDWTGARKTLKSFMRGQRPAPA